ncbi:hypothetical protein GQX73_g5298 [Xylaria multiplex]|uniref:REJ domain-containing protein n=1 Tax=Xylaria multiplex TaxID=323545 RepID=A0A7C8MLP5_9PEZI|nr:hypothetical protein GQX73_g5298 [Xylaria multiplex]
MRPQLITLALTSSNLVSTSAAQQSTSSGNKDSSLQLHYEAGLTTGAATLERRTWASHPPLKVRSQKRHRRGILRRNNQNRHPDDQSDDDSEEEDEGKPEDESHGSHGGGHSSSNGWPSMPTTSFTFSTSTTVPSNVLSPTSTPERASSSIPTATSAPSQSPLTSTSSGDGGYGSGPSHNSQESSGGDGDGGDGSNKGDKDNQHEPRDIAIGVIGGLLFLFFLLFIWYWVAIRRRRRDPLSGQRMALTKDTDMESHVTIDLRNGPQPSHSGLRDPGSSSEGLSLSNYTIPTVPVNVAGTPGVPGTGLVVFESAARSLPNLPSSGVAHTEPYPPLQRAPTASSPATSHTSFMDAHGILHSAYSQAHPKPYLPTRSPQGHVAPVFPPLGTPVRSLALQTDAPPMNSSPTPMTMELDGRPPPPRYPDAVDTSRVPNSSPTSPILVSPLSVASPREDPQVLTHPTMGESQYHSQLRQYQGPRQPSYEGYEPSALPEVVSPICQFGQVSASLPEYDELVETTRSGANSHNFINHHQSDEKQALQQPMPRY